MPKIAVFDLDGTLVDTAPDLTASLNHCLAFAGLDKMPLALARPHAGHGARALLKAAYARAGRTLEDGEREDQVERFLGYYRAHIAIGSQPYPGCLSALDRLAHAGFTLAVCTNKSKALADRLLETLGLAQRFAAVCGHDSFARSKPDRLHLDGTIAEAGGDAASAVMIGDTVTDIDTARAAEVPSVFVTFGYGTGTLAQANASETIDDYDGLTAALLDRLIAGRENSTRPATGPA